MGDANFATLTAPPVLDPDLINAPLALPIVLSSLMGGVCRHVAGDNFSTRPHQVARTVMTVVRAAPDLVQLIAWLVQSRPKFSRMGIVLKWIAADISTS